MIEREIDGYEVRVVESHGRPGEVSLEWRDHAETNAALARGESHLMGFHDFTVPVPVLMAAADMLKDPREEGCLCQGCGRRYRVDMNVPDDVWQKIRPATAEPGGGLLCASCIVSRIEALGIEQAFTLSPTP